MGRRRYRKREEEGSPLEEMLAMAFSSAWVGGFLAILFLVIGLWLRSQPKAAGGLGPLLGGLMLLVSAVLAIAAVLGLFIRSGGAILEAIGGGLAAWLMPRSRTRTTRPAPPLPPQAAMKPGRPSPLRPPPLQAQATGTSSTRAQPGSATALLSKGEMAFYSPLCDVVSEQFQVLVKLSLADVLQCRNEAVFEEAARMHVDFLLCDRATMQPRLAIELDDASHRTPSRAATDRRKDELLRGRGIAVLREPCRTAYDLQKLRERIERALG